MTDKITFALQSGEGTNFEIVARDGDCEIWFVVDEDSLIEMIRMAFDVPLLHIDDLVDALQKVKTEKGLSSAENCFT